MRILFLAIALAAGLLAQTAPEIRGTVQEPGTNAPVPNSEVTLEYYGATQPRMSAAPFQSSTKTQTDDFGKFSFHPADFGYFAVLVQMDGYTPSAQTGYAMNFENFLLTADAPLHESHFFL